MRQRLMPVLLLALVVALVGGCASHNIKRKAQHAADMGDWDAAVQYYLELLDQNPGSVEYKTGLLRSKVRASQSHFEKGKKFQEAGALERAYIEYRQAVELDPTHQYAQVQMEKVRELLSDARRIQDGDESLADLKDKNRGSRPQPPVLEPRSLEPISLDFPKPVSIFDIYRALGKAFGINVQFDSKLRDQELSIHLDEVTAQEALEILMRTATHFYKVLNRNTIIVVEDNQQNRRLYEDLVIQTFFLSNAEVKDAMTILRSLIGAKNIASNDQQNAIVLRDTADKVKVAERLIVSNDKARGEVIVEVELLQIGSNLMRELGVSLSQYQVTQSIEPNPVRVADLEFLNQANWLLSIPSFIYDFVKSTSEAQLLANPHLRISDGETATLHIGDRVPIPVTSFNSNQTIGSNIVPITSFQYQDIGIRLNIEPRIHHNKEVTLKLQVEVSNITGNVSGGGGQQQPIIGTRNIESTIRLKDGETNFLAGLIREDEVLTNTGIPGLSDIPVLGRLFSKKSTSAERTDLVLTLTPHIIRTADITEEDLLPIWVGTEANITFRGGSPRVESDVDGPFDRGDEGDDASAERLREMIRRRIENLPRGLQEGAEEDEESGEEQRGRELVPSAPPEDPFRRLAEPGDTAELLDDAFAPYLAEYELAALAAGSDEDFMLWGPPSDRQEKERVPTRRQPRPETEPDPVTGGVDRVGETGAPSAGSGGDPGPDAGAKAAPDGGSVATASAADSASPAPVAVMLKPGRVVAVPGEIVELEIRADASRAVSHFPLKISFDPKVIRFEEVVAGDFLGGPSRAQVLADASRKGRLTLGASRLGAVGGVRGVGVVARIRFRALKLGETELVIDEARVLTPQLKPITPVRTRAASVSVVSVDERVGDGPGLQEDRPRPGLRETKFLQRDPDDDSEPRRDPD